LKLVGAASSQKFLRDDLITYSQRLDDHVFGVKDSNVQLKPQPVYAEDLMVSRLARWSSANSSQLLWLAGPPSSDLPSTMAIAATSTVACAMQLEVPYIAFFTIYRILLSASNVRTKIKATSREQAAAIGLVYSLIRQLLCKEFVPPEISCGADLSSERFQALDGTDASLATGLSILDTLLDHALPHLLCVIDGINIGSQCSVIIDVLKKHTSSGKPRVFKVLFTTSGPARALMDCTERQERHFIDRDPGKGGRLLNRSKQLWTGCD